MKHLFTIAERMTRANIHERGVHIRSAYDNSARARTLTGHDISHVSVSMRNRECFGKGVGYCLLVALPTLTRVDTFSNQFIPEKDGKEHVFGNIQLTRESG